MKRTNRGTLVCKVNLSAGLTSHLNNFSRFPRSPFWCQKYNPIQTLTSNPAPSICYIPRASKNVDRKVTMEKASSLESDVTKNLKYRRPAMYNIQKDYFATAETILRIKKDFCIIKVDLS